MVNTNKISFLDKYEKYCKSQSRLMKKQQRQKEKTANKAVKKIKKKINTQIKYKQVAKGNLKVKKYDGIYNLYGHYIFYRLCKCNVDFDECYHLKKEILNMIYYAVNKENKCTIHKEQCKGKIDIRSSILNPPCTYGIFHKGFSVSVECKTHI